MVRPSTLSSMMARLSADGVPILRRTHAALDVGVAESGMKL